MDHMVIPTRSTCSSPRRRKKSSASSIQYQEGLITDGERYNKIVDIWAGVADKVTAEMMTVIGKETVTIRRTARSQSSRPSTRSTSWPTRSAR
jgi:DNA-directed RNA polymerase subunit beta'